MVKQLDSIYYHIILYNVILHCNTTNRMLHCFSDPVFNQISLKLLEAFGSSRGLRDSEILEHFQQCQSEFHPPQR